MFKRALSQLDSVDTHTLYSNQFLIPFLHLFPCGSSGIFPFNIHCQSSVSIVNLKIVCYLSRPSYIHRLKYSNNISRVQIMKPLAWFSTSCYFSLLCQNIPFSVLPSSTFKPCFPILVRDRGPHSYTTSRTTVVILPQSNYTRSWYMTNYRSHLVIQFLHKTSVYYSIFSAIKEALCSAVCVVPLTLQQHVYIFSANIRHDFEFVPPVPHAHAHNLSSLRSFKYSIFKCFLAKILY